MWTKHLLQDVLPAHKLMERYIQTHCHNLSVIVNNNSNEEDRENAILTAQN